MNVSPGDFRFAYNIVHGNQHREVCRGGGFIPEAYHGVDGNLAVAPQWNTVTFLPAVGSPAINSGDPAIRDQDESRSDRGRFGGFYGRRFVESIIAYGKYFNFYADKGSEPLPGNGADLTTVARYQNGPCAGRAPGTCRFDTRTIVSLPNGLRVESITAYGKGYNFDVANGHAPWPNNGFDLASVGRYKNGPCAGLAAGNCSFDSRQLEHLTPGSH